MKNKFTKVDNAIPILLLFCLMLLYTCNDVTKNVHEEMNESVSTTNQVIIEPFNLRAKRANGQRPYRYYVAYSTLNEEGTYTHREISMKVPMGWVNKAKQWDRIVHYKMISEYGPESAQRYNGKPIVREVNAVLPDTDEALEWLREQTKKFGQTSWLAHAQAGQSFNAKGQQEVTMEYGFVTECQAYGTCRGTASNPQAECWETVTNNCVTYMVYTALEEPFTPGNDVPQNGDDRKGPTSGPTSESDPCTRPELAFSIECMNKKDDDDEVKPCDEWKNDPVLKHTNVATAIDKLWELSGMDKHVNPANVKEYAAFLIPNGAGGYHTFILDDDKYYINQYVNLIDLRWSKVFQDVTMLGYVQLGASKFPIGTIFVHTHPYRAGQKFSDGSFAKHPSLTSPADEKTIRFLNSKLGIENGMIVSKYDVTLFNKHGLTIKGYKRC